MKIFIESIDERIWDAIINGPYTPKHTVENVHVDKHGLNGLRKKGGKPNMIAIQRISSLHLSTWMSFFLCFTMQECQGNAGGS